MSNNGLRHTFQVVAHTRREEEVVAEAPTHVEAVAKIEAFDVRDLMGGVTYTIREAWTNRKPVE